MYKIAHISDTHISYVDDNLHGTRLVELLKDIEDKKCDHVIITGDLAENPKATDFQYIREILFYYGLLDQNKMSVVPGNHDIFGGAEKGPEGILFSLTCKNINYEENLDNFIETFKETFPNNNSYPFLKIINNIAIIGINSIDRWSEDTNPEGSNGKISGRDLSKLNKILFSEHLKDKIIIVLIHHHLNKPVLHEDMPGHSLWLRIINWKMKLYGRKKLIRFFKKHKVNLILNGHTHINEIYKINELTVVNSSACLMPLTDDQIRKYNIISIPGDEDADKNLNIETIYLQ
ncbi:MAG: metallophosphoesterase [Ignavibacteria bacterium]